MIKSVQWSYMAPLILILIFRTATVSAEGGGLSASDGEAGGAEAAQGAGASEVKQGSSNGTSDVNIVYSTIGKTCAMDTDCGGLAGLSCVAGKGNDKHCDCATPSDTSKCLCMVGGLPYIRWTPEDGACALLLGESPCNDAAANQKCAKGLKCEKNVCKTAAASSLHIPFVLISMTVFFNFYIIRNHGTK